jgi:hypothetical protein
MSTPLETRITILADLWLNYRDDEEFQDFISYNDIGLPIAFALNEDFVKGTEMSTKFINETFDLLLAGLEIEDPEEGWENLDDILDNGVGEL